MNTDPNEILGMSDEEFSKLNHPPAVEPAGEVIVETEIQADPEVKEAVVENEPAQQNDDQGEVEETEQNTDNQNVDKVQNAPQDKSQESGVVDKGLNEGAGKVKPDGQDSQTESTTPNYKAFYEKMMAPLKANGKTIDLKDPEEALQLMQMGANYTRKMQILAPHRKLLMMLESNGLLDESKISYLIDIDKKNPEAIKKLVKDSGIDPLDIDVNEESNYREGNHRVTEDEVNFRSALDELSSNPTGRETLQLINTQWDQASKEILWKEPDVMTLIHQQRENGIYASITTEMDRQRTLGVIPPNIPFLQAYKKIGDDLANAGAFAHLATKTTQAKPQPSLVATRTGAPKPAVVNGDKANAASSTRNSPRRAETIVNPLALSDEDFEKEFSRYKGRV